LRDKRENEKKGTSQVLIGKDIFSREILHDFVIFQLFLASPLVRASGYPR
jgi:hypothetical protein